MSEPLQPRRWTSLDVQERLNFALDWFCRRHYGEDRRFDALPDAEQVRILRAFESAFKSLPRVGC
jgi:hypothetical protein